MTDLIPYDDRILTQVEVAGLTRRAIKSEQCEQLIMMSIPFTINVGREPLVPRSAVEGTAEQAARDVKFLQQQIEWELRDAPSAFIEIYRDAVERCTLAPVTQI